MRILLLIALAVALAGCEDDLAKKERKITNLFESGLPKTGDVWLRKVSMADPSEKVGVIFGFVDDMAFCREIAEMYNAKHRNAGIHCSRAN